MTRYQFHTRTRFAAAKHGALLWGVVVALASAMGPPLMAAPGMALCVGDCNGNGEVTVDEIIKAVNIALGTTPVDTCSASDANGDGMVTINEIIADVNSALSGCPATPTPTGTPAASASPAATSTPTSTPTSIPASTPTATPAPTLTATVAAGPHISIGSPTGAAGAPVMVPISLAKNGPNIVTIAPLAFTFDPGVLTFGGCLKAAGVSAGKAVNAAMPTAGKITVVVSGDLVVLPDGDIVDCTFTIAAGASGSTPLTFLSAAMSDDQFNDYDGSGTSGSVTVGQ